MKWFTLPTLAAAALFSAVVVVPFVPPAREASGTLEVRVRASQAGMMQVYYSDGVGFSEAASARAAVPAGPESQSLLFPLPAGSYRELRLDPLEGEGRVILESLRVRQRGAIVREIAPRALESTHQVTAVRPAGESGAVEIIIAPGAHDPQLRLHLAPPFEIVARTWGELLGREIVPRAAWVFGVMAVLLFAGDRFAAGRRFAAGCGTWITARPRGAIALTAALATVASAYPVVFLGKSYVSPNTGATLLYGGFPTLPGETSSDVLDVRGSDIGAILWQHVGYATIQRRALAEGEWPVWNRYNAAGVPLLGQGQSMFGDPLHLLVVLAHSAAWAWDAKFLLAKWLFALGLGLIVFRAAQASPPGAIAQADGNAALFSALLVAGAAPFIGFFIYRINHPAIFSVCYAPWILHAWLMFADSPHARRSAGALAALMLANGMVLCSGTAKEAVALLVTLNFSGLCVMLAAPTPARQRIAKLAAAAWAALLFALLSAPLWSTFRHTLEHAFTPYRDVGAYQIQPSLLLGAFDEIFYRPLTDTRFVFNPSLNFLLLLGVLYFLVTLRRAEGRIPLVLAAASLVPLALAFGLVPAAWLVRLPLLGNLWHVDNAFTCALLVLWTVLAGAGFARAFQRLAQPEGRGDLGCAALLLFALVFHWIAFRQAVHRPIVMSSTFSGLKFGETIPVPEFVWGSLVALLAAGALFAGTLRRMRARGPSSAGILLAALATLVLLWRHGLHAQAVQFDDYVVQPRARADFHARSAAVEFLHTATTREPARVQGVAGSLFPGWNAIYRLEAAQGVDALTSARLRDLAAAMPRYEWGVAAAEALAQRPLLDALNVRYYVATKPAAATLPLARSADLEVHESPTAWPRAFFTDRVFLYDHPDEFVAAIRGGDGRPFAAAQRDAALPEPVRALAGPLGGRTCNAATDYRLTENTTSFRVRASGPGVIVLNEAHWPGDFRAEVNGRKAPLLRLNHAFKGVWVAAPGEHRVTFRCVPAGFPRHLALAALGGALAAGSFFAAWRRTAKAATLTAAPF